ncbi:DNA cytosine methyltransferase [Staphylococcus hominis]|uniref:DNA cytosine methyltransferase n=1 Tax=Staphylococcus TaxID=1279 RepID=UPI0011A70F72|nr:DNA cytosine methyltransferase [Staphylococcus hominis]MCI2925360.1 DNA cytosine methyltransferase [Staphylococcus hominis]MDK7929154.1 DNA cytosine methyltransferase [Staphylococcus hominis]
MERKLKKKNNFNVVSLFSGVGGLDLGFIYEGFEIIWANDFDKYAVQTYKENINSNIYEGDLNDIYKTIPKHDILIAGFPCQPFSLMGKKLGFQDQRGTLFFTIEKIIKLHKQKPKILVLENVKNLLTHNNGKTYEKMVQILDDLGYKVYSKVLDAKDFGLPQTRRRVFMVCILKTYFQNNNNYVFPSPIELNSTVYDILDKHVEKKYFLSKKILPTILAHGSGKYYSKSEIGLEIARPLTSTMHKMHRANQDNYYIDEKNRNLFKDTHEKEISSIRRLTPNECRKLQGFPSDWKYVVSDTQLYRQFGNAVAVNVSYYLARSINEFLERNNE